MYELAKARKLLRMRSLLERHSAPDPAQLRYRCGRRSKHGRCDQQTCTHSSLHGGPSLHCIRSSTQLHPRAHPEEGMELPSLPTVTLSDADPTTSLSAAATTAPDGAAVAPAPAGGTSLWVAWLRGRGSSGCNHRSSNGSSNPFVTAIAGAAGAASAGATASTPTTVVEPPPTAPCIHHPHAGLTKADLTPAVAALAVQGLSYDNLLSLAELLV